MIESKRTTSLFSEESMEYPIVNEGIVRKKGKLIKIFKYKVDPIQKKRDERKWKESMGYFLLNPEKFKFGFKDLK
ncbi:MAG: hypothetical protein ACFFA4_16460 [Promethearchaeota archaeon]